MGTVIVLITVLVGLLSGLGRENTSAITALPADHLVFSAPADGRDVAEPAVLLVDEPTSALDHERGAAVLALLRTLTRQRATATVLVTHDPAHLDVADTVAEVRDGRLRPGSVARP